MSHHTPNNSSKNIVKKSVETFRNQIKHSQLPSWFELGWGVLRFGDNILWRSGILWWVGGGALPSLLGTDVAVPCDSSDGYINKIRILLLLWHTCILHIV